ncbi:MAG: polyprenyl synthetase family protein [Eubacteriales bacterium]|nr:polyprenyl synthetase family protein [Eubacteriales bacterium]
MEHEAEFLLEYNQKVELINEWLENVVPQAEGDCIALYKALRYSLFAGGKRIRPVIAMAVCEMLGGDVEQVMPFACAIELIHTYSLIHDDLPAMDNDDLRRGQPTCHKKFDEATAILVGDALQALAFEIMSRSEINPIIVLECIRTVATAAGGDGMVGGQIRDIGGCEDAELHNKMNNLKTGALIMASAWMGALVGKAAIEDYRPIGIYAQSLGIAFQVKDDILDVEGNAEKLGKKTGQDSVTDKITYVSHMGLDRAKDYLLELTDNCKDEIAIFGEKSFFLQDLATYLYERDN